MPRKVYLHKYDPQIGRFLFEGSLSFSELKAMFLSSYPNSNHVTLLDHLRGLVKRGLVVKGRGAKNTKRSAKYALTEKGRLLHHLGIFAEDALHARKLVRLILLFDARHGPFEQGFTLDDFMDRRQYDYDLSEEEIEMEVPTGTLQNPEWEWQKYGRFDVPFDRREVLEMLGLMEKHGFLSEHRLGNETRYKIKDKDLNGFILTVWINRYVYYGRMRNYWQKAGKPSQEERKWLRGLMGRRNADDLLTELDQVLQSKKKSRNERIRDRKYYESWIRTSLNNAEKISAKKKEIKKIIAKELIDEIFDYNFITRRHLRN